MKKVVITELETRANSRSILSDLPDPSRGEVQLAVEYSVVAGSDVNMRTAPIPFRGRRR